MGKYLKKFETVAQYTAAQPNLILPNVSLITETNSVAYNPTSPAPTYEYVDLGLPSGTLWAKWNVGATSETEYGNYYQYGKGADTYETTSGQSDYAGDEIPLAASADTATQVWGSDWHMPTYDQMRELESTANTTYTWETDFNGSGVNGGKFTSKTDPTKYIFIPAGGQYDSTGSGQVISERGSRAYSWTSTLEYVSMASAYYPQFILLRSDAAVYGSVLRANGFPIRPVMDA